MARGGKRAGAGNKKGNSRRPSLSNYFTPNEIAQLVLNLKKGSKKNPKIQMFLMDHLFGKPTQSIDLGDDFVPTQIIINGNAKRKE